MSKTHSGRKSGVSAGEQNRTAGAPVARGAGWRRGGIFLLGLCVALALGEVVARVWFRRQPQVERLRAFLAGEIAFDENSYDTAPQLTVKYIGQAYLNYVPAPNWRDGVNYHNEMGFRGRAVPVARTPGVARVLCLGGSTTYGEGVDAPESAYPGQMEQILNANLPPGYERVEVINGGLNWGTTAEALCHYHFKYHYFRPDVVVLNVGGNDAAPLAYPYYQPDYSHWRKPLAMPQPLAPLGQTVLKSRLAAVCLLPLFYGQRPTSIWIQRPAGTHPPTTWYPPARQSDPAVAQRMALALPDAELAFTHNVQSLIDEVLKDGAVPLLVPFRLAPGLEHLEEAPSIVLRDERILRGIATARGLPLAPFPASVISPANWLDSCHLNEGGEREKAVHVAAYVRELLAARH
ncbi:MAG: hypothetical protein K8T26_17655 [Lentisphaerae bacterium]|nr:hypothetical protein [Lentisphaerota bacterium]